MMFQRLDAKEAGASSAQKEMTFDDLEAMVNGGAKTATAAPKPQPAPAAKPKPTPSNPWLSKPSAEIKQEVLRLKNAKQVKEATQLLQILKQVIQKEKDEAEAENCRKITEKLTEQIEVCKTQLQLWQLFEWFVDSVQGKEQCQAWTEYQTAMHQAIEDVQKKGSAAVTISKVAEISLHTLNGDDLEALVESGPETETSPPELDGELEVSVLGLVGMHENSKLVKAWRKHCRESATTSKDQCPRLWIDSKVQLPLHPQDPAQPVHLAFKPTKSTRNGAEYEYEFDSDSKHSRQRLNLPTKDSKEAKTLQRRMETKTVQCNVFLSPNQDEPVEPKKSSWFFGSRAKEEEPEDHSENKGAMLGKVVLELHPLLVQSCIVGDYPLMVNNQEIGGVVRIALRAVQYTGQLAIK
ncbi:MAG: hypothetical protein SGARI_003506 [Bacillariaceae sp.]